MHQIDLISAKDITTDEQKTLLNQVIDKKSNIVKINFKNNPELINGEILILNSVKADYSTLGKLNKIFESIV